MIIHDLWRTQSISHLSKVKGKLCTQICQLAYDWLVSAALANHRPAVVHKFSLLTWGTQVSQLFSQKSRLWIDKEQHLDRASETTVTLINCEKCWSWCDLDHHLLYLLVREVDPQVGHHRLDLAAAGEPAPVLVKHCEYDSYMMMRRCG